MNRPPFNLRRCLAALLLGAAVFVPHAAWAQLTTGPGGSGVTVGNSSLIGQLDLSDTFTGFNDGGPANRPYAAAIQPAPAYVLENTYGNVSRSWTNSFSFARDPVNPPDGFSNGTPAFPGGNGSGTASGFTQTGVGGGGVDFGVAYGLRNAFVAQFDAVQNTDRVDITVSSGLGGIADASGLSVFFRTTGSALPEIGIYRAGVGETNSTFTSGIVGNTWNNYAVAFDRANNSIEVFVNDASRGSLDLNTFAGGAYADFNSANVNLGGAGGSRVWTDNAQIGTLGTPIGPASLVSYVNFDESAT
ncbi:MAG: hypothetical protein KDA41_14010, partial [Planctomycetales bacterium]|nr:hypothetical protein [Planctomycetales bacterium]